MAVAVDQVHRSAFGVAQYGAPERLHVGDDKGLDGDFDHLHGARVGYYAQLACDRGNLSGHLGPSVGRRFISVVRWPG